MKWYYWVGVALTIVLAISTLVPAPARKACLLGYRALCPFTPISTIILFAIAGIIYWFGTRKGSGASSSARF